MAACDGEDALRVCIEEGDVVLVVLVSDGWVMREEKYGRSVQPQIRTWPVAYFHMPQIKPPQGNPHTFFDKSILEL